MPVFDARVPEELLEYGRARRDRPGPGLELGPGRTHQKDAPVAGGRRRVHAAARGRPRARRSPCRSAGLRVAVRLNGTSDIRWELVASGEHENVMNRFPGITFYDYTKWPLERRPVERTPGNYHLTFSLSEANRTDAERALLASRNVAVVFATCGGPLPARYAIGAVGAEVIDGDLHDLRFLDPVAPGGRGVIVGLRAKGRARHDTTGFVQTPSRDQPLRMRQVRKDE